MRTIAAAADTVWSVLADFGSLSSWADGVDHSCVLRTPRDGGPVGLTRRVQAGRATLVERITTFEPPRTLAYDVAGLPPQLGRIANRWSVTPTGDGSCTVTLTSTVESGGGRLATLRDRAVARAMTRLSGALLASLAHRSEITHD